MNLMSTENASQFHMALGTFVKEVLCIGRPAAAAKHLLKVRLKRVMRVGADSSLLSCSQHHVDVHKG